MNIIQQLEEQGERLDALREQIRVLETARQIEADRYLTLYSKYQKSIRTASAVMNTQAPTALQIVPNPAKSAIPRAVMVNWSRGFSGAAYPVLAHGEKDGKRFFVLDISTDENKPMLKRVWESETKVDIESMARAIVLKRAA